MSASDISNHISAGFNAEMGNLRNKVLKMGGVVEERVTLVVKALQTRDTEVVKLVAKSDHQVNELEIKIDKACSSIFALRNPVARDLRMVIAVSKIITDLERVGDEAQRIAKQILEMGQTEIPAGIQQELNKLGKHANGMLHKALDSFARSRIGALKELKDQDRKVDSEYNVVVDAFITAVSQPAADIRSLLSALWCARALERIGDHSKNISEYVVYVAEGKDIRHPS